MSVANLSLLSSSTDTALLEDPFRNALRWRSPDSDTGAGQFDAAVFDAYGWPHDLIDEQILERLLSLNLERASKLGKDSNVTK